VKSLIFLILLVPIWAQAEEAPKVISIKEYNPQQKYEGRICVVDLYGEMECKEAPKKPEQEQAQQKKTLESLKPTDPLIPAANSGWEGAVQVSGVGTFRGVGLLAEKRNDHWSFGGTFKFNMYSPPVGSSSSRMEMMGLVTANYFVFPRWYAYSNKKVFDLSVNVQAGYNMVSQTSSEDNRESSPVVGMGARVSYPLTDALRLQTGVDVYQNFSLKSVGTSGYVGIGFNF
jgi:hypothetical protein